MKMLQTFSVVFAAIAIATPVLAHSPYLTHKTAWTGPDGKDWALALLNGDAIIGPWDDPNRPVVLNPEGKIVAIGPIHKNPVVVCFSARDCRFLTDAEALVPDPATFGSPREIDFYPESLNKFRSENGRYILDQEFQTYGMRHSELTWLEWPRILLPVFRSAPIVTVVFLIPLLGIIFSLGRRFAFSRYQKVRFHRFIVPGFLAALFGSGLATASSVLYSEAAIATTIVALIAGLLSGSQILSRPP
jgi:hypothetical protein